MSLCVPVATRYLADLRSILFERASRTFAVGVGRVPSLTMKTTSSPPFRKSSMDAYPIGLSMDSPMTSSGSPHSTSLG